MKNMMIMKWLKNMKIWIIMQMIMKMKKKVICLGKLNFEELDCLKINYLLLIFYLKLII